MSTLQVGSDYRVSSVVSSLFQVWYMINNFSVSFLSDNIQVLLELQPVNFMIVMTNKVLGCDCFPSDIKRTEFVVRASNLY